MTVDVDQNVTSVIGSTPERKSPFQFALAI